MGEGGYWLICRYSQDYSWHPSSHHGFVHSRYLESHPPACSSLASFCATQKRHALHSSAAWRSNLVRHKRGGSSERRQRVTQEEELAAPRKSTVVQDRHSECAQPVHQVRDPRWICVQLEDGDIFGLNGRLEGDLRCAAEGLQPAQTEPAPHLDPVACRRPG